MPRTTDKTISIKSATLSDLAELETLFGLCGHDHNESCLQESLDDGCLMVARQGTEIQGCIGLSLRKTQICGLWFKNPVACGYILSRMIDRIERLAVQFGLKHINIKVPRDKLKMFQALAYHPVDQKKNRTRSQSGKSALLLNRSLARRQTRYGRQVQQICRDLGIAENYGQVHRLALQKQANHLTSIGPDCYQREQQMTPTAARAWFRMKAAAEKDGIVLQAVSAFRSLEYQTGLLERKLKTGKTMDDILEVSAAPGFSEHHTGKAIDITTPGFDVLEQEFDRSPAFRWLREHAESYSFYLSFPKKNRHKLAYEPWHWCFQQR